MNKYSAILNDVKFNGKEMIYFAKFIYDKERSSVGDGVFSQEQYIIFLQEFKKKYKNKAYGFDFDRLDELVKYLKH